MSVTFSRVMGLSAVVAVITAAALFSAVALGSQRARPDVRVISGSARVTTARAAAGRPAPAAVISGSFRVRNAGARAAAHFRGWVELTAPERSLLVRDYTGGMLKRAGTVTFRLHRSLPRTLARVNWTIRACVVLGTTVRATPAGDGCRTLGTYTLARATPGAPPGSTTPSTAPVATVPHATTPGLTAPPSTSTAPAPAPPSTSTAPAPAPPSTSTATAPAACTPPTGPVTDYTPDQRFFEPDCLGQYEGYANTAPQTDVNGNPPYSGGFYTRGYWVDVPPSYTGDSPETLVVWLHGCGGVALDDLGELTSVYSSDRPYIMIAPNGPEGAGADNAPDCWDTGDQTDVSQVLTDIAQVETEFDIDHRRVIIAGYSSGGDLAYQTIFLHADTFAGIYAMNTDPVRDNTFDDSIPAAVAAAAYAFPIVQIAHTGDMTYPTSTVQPHLSALKNAGFPTSYTQIAGDHYDDDAPAGCSGNGDPTANPPVPACTSGTYHDLADDLLSQVGNDGWEAPAS